MALIYLAEIVAATDASGTTTTLRYAAGAGYNHASAPGYYEPRIVQAANADRNLIANGRVRGRSEVGFGETTLANPDGALDALIGYSFERRDFTLLLGDDMAAYSSFVTILKGTIEQAEFTFDEVRFRIRDRQFSLDIPIQTTKFAGNNSLPNGLEGVATDIGGKPKPRMFGKGFRIPGPQVNSSRLIYQVNDGAIQDVPAAYDNGLALTKGADYTSQGDMETNAPAAGGYRVWKGGGYVRLGSTPAGPIAFDVEGDARGGTFRVTAADIAKEIVVQYGGLASGDVTAADITALNTANGADIGIWIDGERTVADVLDEAAGAVGAWWGFGRDGKFRIVRIESPSGTAALTFKRGSATEVLGPTDVEIVSLERVASNDDGRGLPAYRVILDYYKNHTVVSLGEISASTGEAERNFLARDFRSVIDTDVSIKTQWLGALELSFRSAMISASAAATEAARLLALHKVRRDTLRLMAKLDATLAASVDLGSVVEIKMPRFGLAAGKKFLVTGLRYDAAAEWLELTLWG